MATQVDRIRALADVSRMRARDGDLAPLLEAVARAIAESLAFRVVVINLHRPAWDDYEVVVVYGSEDARQKLLGQRSPSSEFEGLLLPRFERAGCYFITDPTFEWPGDERDASWLPDLEPIADPDAWRAEDGLFVPMTSRDGEPLGVVSVDSPESGMRPTDEDLEVLSAIAAHAALAIESAQEEVEGARHRAALDHLLRISAGLRGQESVDRLLTAVCEGVQEALDFDRVAVFLAEPGDDWLQPRAQSGWGGIGQLAAGVSRRVIAPIFDWRHRVEGCQLVDGTEAAELLPPGHHLYASVRNGRGPKAWNRHWLVVPLHSAEGELIGFLWPDDPRDHLVPSRWRLQALRLFADQVSSALESAHRMGMLRYLAEHDPLTGLRNRRDLGVRVDAEIAASEAPVSLLLCDLDHFKQVNDHFGHEAGDRALARFADLLRECARSTDTAARLGGEEFALVLPGTDPRGAWLIAERLRRRCAAEFSGPGDLGLRVSIGVATSGRDGHDAESLLGSADKALYAAKRLGRDRTIAFDEVLVGRLLAAHDGDGAAQELLAAVMLLAETLDMRDAGTARHSETVGHYAQLIARTLGWEPDRVERMRIAGVLHDVGKIGVSDATLRKPGALDDAEWEEMRRHCELGAQIVAGANLSDVADWVLAHHERMDGTGYPAQLGPEAIPIEARVLAVADAYEAMTSSRPYRDALAPAQARAELVAGAERGQFDRDVVDVFLAALHAEEAARAASPSGAAPAV